MSTQEISRDEVHTLYEQFVSVPADIWEEADEDSVERILSEEDAFAGAFDPEQLKAQFRVYGYVANEYTEEDFYRYLTEGDLPPVELPDRELELVRGGSDDPEYNTGTPSQGLNKLVKAAGYYAGKAYEAWEDNAEDHDLGDVGAL